MTASGKEGEVQPSGRTCVTCRRGCRAAAAAMGATQASNGCSCNLPTTGLASRGQSRGGAGSAAGRGGRERAPPTAPPPPLTCTAGLGSSHSLPFKRSRSKARVASERWLQASGRNSNRAGRAGNRCARMSTGSAWMLGSGWDHCGDVRKPTGAAIGAADGAARAAAAAAATCTCLECPVAAAASCIGLLLPIACSPLGQPPHAAQLDAMAVRRAGPPSAAMAPPAGLLRSAADAQAAGPPDAARRRSRRSSRSSRGRSPSSSWPGPTSSRARSTA